MIDSVVEYLFRGPWSAIGTLLGIVFSFIFGFLIRPAYREIREIVRDLHGETQTPRPSHR